MNQFKGNWLLGYFYLLQKNLISLFFKPVQFLHLFCLIQMRVLNSNFFIFKSRIELLISVSDQMILYYHLSLNNLLFIHHFILLFHPIFSYLGLFHFYLCRALYGFRLFHKYLVLFLHNNSFSRDFYLLKEVIFFQEASFQE